MKAILVIDMPDGIDVDEVLVDYCLHTKDKYKSIRKGGNHPLKPMPSIKNDDTDEKGYYIGMFNYGWNECIKEIEK